MRLFPRARRASPAPSTKAPSLTEYLVAVVMSLGMLWVLHAYRLALGFSSWMSDVVGYAITGLLVALIGARFVQWVTGSSSSRSPLFLGLGQVARIIVSIFVLWGLVVYLNAVLDHSEGTEEPGAVAQIHRHASWLGGRARSTVAVIHQRDGSAVRLPLHWDEAERVWASAPVLVKKRSGFFGMPWVEAISLDQAVLTERILEVHPQAAGVWAERMIHFAQRFDQENAVAAARQYAALARKGSRAVQTAAGHFLWAHRNEGALALFDIAWGIQPDFKVMHKSYWILLAREGRRDEAEALLTRAMAQYPTDAHVYISMAELYWATGDAAKQLIWVDKALAIDPSLPLQAERERLVARLGAATAKRPSAL